MSPTPKSARQWTRKARSNDRTHNVNGYRVEASWHSRPDLPVVIKTADRKHAYRKARQWAAEGAYVIVQAHQGWDRWRTLDEFDGPALAAELQAAERTAIEDARRAAQAAEDRIRAEAERASLARLMVRPPVMRDATGRVTARHTTGAGR
ncbi:hypothetical protein ACFZB5_33545 [Streptomyces nodosus]|uniref:hypothetical protein n=1 Tax=Streptomyces nodosus TaxID=40318 RepID=UPI0036E6B390